MQNTSVVPVWPSIHPSNTSAVLAGMCLHTALTVAEQFQAVGYEREAPPGQTDGQKLLGPERAQPRGVQHLLLAMLEAV